MGGVVSGILRQKQDARRRQGFISTSAGEARFDSPASALLRPNEAKHKKQPACIALKGIVNLKNLLMSFFY